MDYISLQNFTAEMEYLLFNELFHANLAKVPAWESA